MSAPLLRLDADGTVRLGDRAVRLTPSSRALLNLLAEHPGEVVTPRQAEHLMPGRRALGESAAAPTYIETVPGFGYRLRPEMVVRNA